MYMTLKGSIVPTRIVDARKEVNLLFFVSFDEPKSLKKIKIK